MSGQQRKEASFNTLLIHNFIEKLNFFFLQVTEISKGKKVLATKSAYRRL